MALQNVFGNLALDATSAAIKASVDLVKTAVDAVTSAVSSVNTSMTNGNLRGTVVVSNPTANPETGLAKDATLTPRYSDAVKTYAQLVSASGNTDITPTVGKRIRVLWVAFVPSSDNATSNLVTISHPTTVVNLYVGYAMAHWQRFDVGAVNEVLRINLANAQPVAVTIHYEEI